jgi:hypothetical protein
MYRMLIKFIQEREAMPHIWKLYRRKGLSSMRPYIPGEDLTGITVSKEDIPELGGMIARNPDNSADQWYVAKAWFAKNYELAYPEK